MFPLEKGNSVEIVDNFLSRLFFFFFLYNLSAIRYRLENVPQRYGFANTLFNTFIYD